MTVSNLVWFIVVIVVVLYSDKKISLKELQIRTFFIF